MFSKGSKLYSIFNNKCPRCHQGSFFNSSPYNLKEFSAMPRVCSVCGQPYEPEPGYYYGAMYVSYAINVAIFMALWIAWFLLFRSLNIWWMIFISIFVGLILTPLTFRYARLIWINFFVKYRPG